MDVRSSGDPIEITGERDRLAISCDLSEVHSCNHTHSGYSHEECVAYCRGFIHTLQDLCRGGRLSGGRELTHVFVDFCMTVWDNCIVLRDLGLEFCMRLFHDPWYT